MSAVGVAERGLEEAAGAVNGAGGYADLFGEGDGDVWLARARAQYRKLALVLHPDRAGAAGDEPFAKLGELWEQARRHGEGVVGPFVLETRRGRWECDGLMARGEVANLYAGVGACGRVAAKMVRGPANNDLVANEARLLSTLQREVDGKYRAYFPELVAGFRHRDSKDGVMRRVNVLTRLDGFYNLREVREAYPGGVEARSVAWMWRRLLVAVGAAKQAGVVHGCITPDHVLILPEQHGLVLVDWCYGVETGGTISAISPTWRSAYPREVLAKAAVDGGVDVAMAAWTCLWLMGERAPKQLVAFGQGCMMKSPGMRPKDGWEVLSEFNELLERLWGKRKFVPFAMPAGSTGRVG